MESSNASPIDDSNNLDTAMQDLVVAKYEDCDSEVLATQDDQTVEPIYIEGYLEVQEPGSENATFYLNSQEFNLNGHRLILTQNDEGNEVFYVVGDEINTQSLEQNFTHTSVLHTDDSFKVEIKEQEVDEASQSFEAVKTEEVPQEQKRHVYIENTGVIKFERESVDVLEEHERHVCIENNDRMIKIGRESVVVPQEEEKHMCIESNDRIIEIERESINVPQEEERHVCIEKNDTMIEIEKESIDMPQEQEIQKRVPLLHLVNAAEGFREVQKSGNSETDVAKDADFSLTEIKASVIVTQDTLDKDPNLKLAITDSESTQTADNAVSVIHITSDLQNNFENQTKLGISYEISCPEKYNPQKNEDELPADVLSSSASRDSLQEPTDLKQMEDRCNKDLEDDTIPDEVDESNTNNSLLNTELGILSADNSPKAFKEQLGKLDDTLDIENNSMDDDDSSHAGSCLLVVEEDESKDGGNTSDDKYETVKDAEMTIGYQKKQEKRIKVPTESATDSISKSVNVDTSKLNISVKKESPPLSTKYSVFSYKSKAKTLFSTGSSLSVSALHPVCDAGEISEAMSQYDFSESEEVHFKDADCKKENHKSKLLNSQQDLLVEKLTADLVITENAGDLEMNSGVTVTHSSQNLKLKETIETKPTSVTTDIQLSPPANELSEEISENVSTAQDSLKVSSKDSPCENNIDDSLNRTCSSSKEGEDSEETFVIPPKKTYILKKNRMPSNVCDVPKNGIELFSLDNVNFSECDKEIEEAKKSINIDQCKHVLNVATKDSETEPYELNISEPGPSHANSTETISSPENGTTTDDFFSMHNVKVSATYDKKKPKPDVKISSSKQEIVLRRTRSSASKRSLENGTLDDPNSETHKNSFDSSSSENIPWGDVLLRTSFQSSTTNDASGTSQTNLVGILCTSEAALKDIPSTSQATSNGAPSTSPVHITSTPISEQQRRRTNKLKRDFDRLLHSPKSKAPSHKKVNSSKKIFSDIKRKKKKDKSKLNSPSSKSDTASGSSLNLEYPESVKEVRVKRPRYSNVKKAAIQYLRQDAVSPTAAPSKKDNDNDYHCSRCNFSSSLVNNLIEHLKYCENNRQPYIDYTLEDMDKRQRIRGEEIQDNSEKLRNYLAGSYNEMRNLNDEGEYSGLPQNHIIDSDDDEMDIDADDKKSKYGYGVDDVVWAKVEDRFWPGLVCKLEERKASIKLINYPNEKKGLKISAERAHTFDDAKWNKMLLAEAENLPNNEIFVRAVQTSETFVRKKWLGLPVKGKDFFSIPDKVDFVTDSESSDSNINEDSDSEVDQDICLIPQHRKARYAKLDIEKIKDYIIEGHTDKHVLDIHHGKYFSDRHEKYNASKKDKSLGGQGTWFGPCEYKCEQGILVDHFQKLFLEHIGQKNDVLSYVLQVWIPEAIVKAVSAIQGIPLKQAEDLIESEDSMDPDDPTIEEIEKMYS